MRGGLVCKEYVIFVLCSLTGEALFSLLEREIRKEA